MKRAIFAVVLGIVLTQGREAAAADLTLSSTTITPVAGTNIYYLDINITGDGTESIVGVDAKFSITNLLGATDPNSPLINTVTLTASGAVFQNPTRYVNYTGPSTNNVAAADSVGALGSSVTLSSTPQLLAQIGIDTTSVPATGGTWLFQFSDLSGNSTDFQPTGTGMSYGPTDASEAITISAVPEPATWAGLATLAGIAVPLLVWRHRRKLEKQRRRRHRSSRLLPSAKTRPEQSSSPAL